MLKSGVHALHAQVTKEEVVQTLRRQSKGFQKTSSQYRGVTRHQKGKWEARIGQMVGKKYKWAQLLTACMLRTPCLSHPCSYTCNAGRQDHYGHRAASSLQRMRHCEGTASAGHCGCTGSSQ